MIKTTNVFILTTEYHFLLSVNIINEKYDAREVKNILVFTGERLSGILIKNLPVNIETCQINVAEEQDLKKKINDIILRHALANLFVFTAYRDLETYLLLKVNGSVNRHLVQDGANFYFHTVKPVLWSRIKETIKIYRNLWRKGILFVWPVLFKTHMAQCSFVDYVWLTNPEVYTKPLFSGKPVIKINLLTDRGMVSECCKYFDMVEIPDASHTVIYLSSRFNTENAIRTEIAQIKSVIAKLSSYKLLVKLHPNAPTRQVDLFEDAFKGCVVKNFIPAELYITRAKNTYVIGGVTASLYYNNPACYYFSLVRIYQRLGLFSKWTNVRFPSHVKEIKNIDDLVNQS